MPEDHPKDTAGFTVPISGTPLSATPLPSISVPVPDPASPPNIDAKPGISFPIKTAVQLPGVSFSVGSEDPGLTVDLDKDTPTPPKEKEPSSEDQSSLYRYWLLRLQKIAQQYKYINSTETTAEINQATIEELFQSLEKENAKFKNKDPSEPITQRHNEKYTQEQLEEFQKAGINVHKALSINKKTDKSGGFEIKFGDNIIDVSLQGSEVSITGNATKDSIPVMLLAAMHAKKKLGAKATYAIYPNTNMEAIAELYARAQSTEYQLKPEFKCHPYDDKKTKEVYDAEFQQFQAMTASPTFKKMVEDFKNLNNNINPDFKPQAGHETDPAKKSTETAKENADGTAPSLEAKPTTDGEKGPSDPSFRVNLPPKPR